MITLNYFWLGQVSDKISVGLMMKIAATWVRPAAQSRSARSIRQKVP
jgi:hypothetical protein